MCEEVQNATGLAMEILALDVTIEVPMSWRSLSDVSFSPRHKLKRWMASQGGRKQKLMMLETVKDVQLG